MGRGYDDTAIIERVMQGMREDTDLSRRQAILSILPVDGQQASNLRRIEMKMARMEAVPSKDLSEEERLRLESQDDPRVVVGLSMASGIMLSALAMPPNLAEIAVSVGLGMTVICLHGALRTDAASRRRNRQAEALDALGEARS